MRKIVLAILILFLITACKIEEPVEIDEKSSSLDSSSIVEESISEAVKKLSPSNLDLKPEDFNLTKEEYEEIYNNISYEQYDIDVLGEAFLDSSKSDETTINIRKFLSKLFCFSYPEDFKEPSEIDKNFALFTLMMNTKRAHWQDDSEYQTESAIYEVYYVKELEFLKEAEIYEGHLEKSLDETAENLFGEKLSLNYESEAFPYYKNLKLFTTMPFGMYTVYSPEIMSYKEIEGGYEVEFVLGMQNMGKWVDNDFNPLEEDKVKDFLLNDAQRFKSEISIKDDSYILHSFIKI